MTNAELGDKIDLVIRRLDKLVELHGNLVNLATKFIEKLDTIPVVIPPVLHPPPVPIEDPPPVPSSQLPPGYDKSTGMAWEMLQHTIKSHHMDAVEYQGRGKEICELLNADWPGLNCYAHNKSDAVMWPGFGSLDITIDSGKGGWYFNPDGEAAYGEGR